MSFLQPLLLFGLPLALLPIVIHLINQNRHRTVEWAAMMFLLDAKKMTRGIARLRQILILSMRVLAVLALLFAASRPLTSGWLSAAGGKADTVVILLDRSASMEQQNLETGQSKRSTALAKMADLLEKTGKGTEIVLIDSATMDPIRVETTAALLDLPQIAPTETAADIPALLQTGLDYLASDESGRADIWLASDLRQSDWMPAAGRWETLRSDIAAQDGVRLFLLTFPQAQSSNFSISVSRAQRRRTSEGQELVLDFSIRRSAAPDNADVTLPVEFTINGTRIVESMTITGDELVRLGHVIRVSSNNERGWGRIDLPADENPADNTGFFVYDEPTPRKTVILSDDNQTAEAIAAAATAPVDPAVAYESITIPTDRVEQIPWEEAAQLFWQAPFPADGSTEQALLQQHVASGRTLVLLPPFDPGETSLFGVQWQELVEEDPEIGWWRTESGLLANTRSGSPLPVSELRIAKTRTFSGELQPILKLATGESVIARLIPDADQPSSGAVFVWGTLPRSDYSTLASEGVVFFVMTHRGLDEGANATSRARFETVGTSLENNETPRVLASSNLTGSPFTASAREYATDPPRLVALNRPTSEDDEKTLDADILANLLEGVEYQQINDEVDSGDLLASEIWRAFLIAMALALLAEAILCLPPKTESNPVESMT